MLPEWVSEKGKRRRIRKMLRALKLNEGFHQVLNLWLGSAISVLKKALEGNSSAEKACFEVWCSGIQYWR